MLCGQKTPEIFLNPLSVANELIHLIIDTNFVCSPDCMVKHDSFCINLNKRNTWRLNYKHILPCGMTMKFMIYNNHSWKYENLPKLSIVNGWFTFLDIIFSFSELAEIFRWCRQTGSSSLQIIWIKKKSVSLKKKKKRLQCSNTSDTVFSNPLIFI